MTGQPAEKDHHDLLRESLDYRLPGSGRPLGHIVLRRDQAEAIWKEWIEERRDHDALIDANLGVVEAGE